MNVKLEVSLNGTKTNPFHKFGWKQNPFPQLGRAQYDGMCLHLAKLGADPIPNKAYIRKHLEGWSEEFVDLLCSKFVKGRLVQFTVTFPMED